MSVKRVFLALLSISLMASGFYILACLYLDIPEALHGSSSSDTMRMMGYILVPSRDALQSGNSVLYTIIAVVEIIIGVLASVFGTLLKEKEKNDEESEE